MEYTKEEIQSLVTILENLDEKEYNDPISKYADIMVTTKRVKFLFRMPLDYTKSDTINHLKKLINA